VYTIDRAGHTYLQISNFGLSSGQLLLAALDAVFDFQQGISVSLLKPANLIIADEKSVRAK
jgi:hypothetical protein